MRKTNKIYKIVICVILIVSLCGCWNKHELNELGIVMGVGVDKAPREDKVQITAQVVKPGEIKSMGGKSSGGSKNKTFWNIKDTGDCVFDTIRDMTNQSSRKLYFPHNQVVIYGRSIAEEGLAKYLDFFFRDHETRVNVYILIADGSASDVLDVEPQLEQMPAVNIAKVVVSQANATSQTIAVRLKDFKSRLMSGTTAPVAPIIGIIGTDEEKVAEITGTAVFKKDKLVGELNKTEGRGLLWVLGEVKSGIIKVNSSSDNPVNLEIVRAKAKYSPEIKDGKVKIKISILEEGTIAEQSGSEDLSSTSEIEFLEKQKSEAIKSEVLAAFAKAKELNADIFGFGDAINDKYPIEWKTMKDDWDNIFQTIEVDVNVQAKLRLMGRINKPVLSK